MLTLNNINVDNRISNLSVGRLHDIYQHLKPYFFFWRGDSNMHGPIKTLTELKVLFGKIFQGVNNAKKS